MKRLPPIVALWLALAGLASAQQILTSSPVYTAASSPPLVLYVANFSEFNVALTANAQILFSLPTVAPNSIPFRVNFCQDATGGWQPTFSTVTGATIVNRVGALNVNPAANTCSTQFWTFRAATNQVILMAVSPFMSAAGSIGGAFNIEAFGADPTGLSDSQPAIEATISAACAAANIGAAPVIYVPVGNFTEVNPGYSMCGQALEMDGASEYSSSLIASATFPEFVSVPNDYLTTLSPISGAPLATSTTTTNSMLWGTNNSHWWIPVEEAASGPGSPGVSNFLNGRSTLSVEMWIDPEAWSGDAPGTVHGIIAAEPPNVVGNNIAEDMVIFHTFTSGASTIKPCLRVSGTGLVCGSSYAITNATHFIQMILGGGLLKFAIDGVDQTSGGLTAAGTTVEAFNDTVTLGYSATQGGDNFMGGRIDGVCISSSAQTIANQTAKFSHSGTHCDLYLNNGTHVGTITGTDSAPFISADYANGSSTPIWSTIRGFTTGPTTGLSIFRHLNFIAGTDGLFTSGLVNSFLEDLAGNSQTYESIEAGYLGFASVYRNWKFTPAGSSGSCYHFYNDAFGDSSGDGLLNCVGSGAYRPQLWINQGGGVLHNAVLSASSTTRRAVEYDGNGSITDAMKFDNLKVDSENGAPDFTAVYIDANTSSVVFDGGSLQSTGTGYCLSLDSVFSSPIELTMIGTICKASGGGTPSFAAHVGSATFLQPATWLNGSFNGAALTSANASDSTINFNLGRPIPAILTALPTCNAALDGIADRYIVTDATTCTTGSLITNGGTTYCTAICHSGTGWVH